MPSTAPLVGFLGLRLESTPHGVRAAVTWNTNVADRRGDQSVSSLDVVAAMRKVQEFVDEYMEAASRW